MVCSCTISASNSLYNQWNISHELCESTINGSIQLNRIGVLCSNEYQNCGSDIRAWNEPSNNSIECETSTILIRASHDLDGLAFECQDGTNGSNGTPTSYGRTVLSVICTLHRLLYIACIASGYPGCSECLILQPLLTIQGLLL